MPKKQKNNYLNRNRSRITKEPEEIELKIGEKNENFNLISYKLKKANKLF